MKTKDFSIIFHKEDVQHFVQVIGDLNPLYYDIEIARTCGYESIPLPPTMPMIAYKQIETPWKLQPPVILRKQKCINHQIMYIEKPYKGHILLSDTIQRNHYTFIKQMLLIYEMDGSLIFEGTSHMIAGDLI